MGEFPGLVVRTPCSQCKGPGSTSSQGTKIPQAVQHALPLKDNNLIKENVYYKDLVNNLYE